MKKLAVHLHLYYTEQLPEILKYLRNLNKIEHDLFVTIVKDDQNVITQLRAFNPQAKIWVVENRGYDIGPFIDFLHHINIDDYEYILKLHTKGKKSKNYTWLNGRRFDNALWGKILWESLLATPERLQENLMIMDENQTFGLLGSKYCLTSSKKNYEKLLPQINVELKKIGLNQTEELSFIAGSMFIGKASVFKPLLHYTIHDFQPTDGKVKEGTLAHIIERVIGGLITNQGYVIKTIKHKSYAFYYIYFMYVSFKRFLYQKKITNSNRVLIKICKLPIYQGKNG